MHESYSFWLQTIPIAMDMASTRDYVPTIIHLSAYSSAIKAYQQRIYTLEGALKLFLTNLLCGCFRFQTKSRAILFFHLICCHSASRMLISIRLHH